MTYKEELRDKFAAEAIAGLTHVAFTWYQERDNKDGIDAFCREIGKTAYSIADAALKYRATP